MSMLTTGVVMPVGVEQANVLQAPALSGDGPNESFAKSFGELTAGTVGMMVPVAGGQAQTGDLKGKTEAVSSTETLVQAPATKVSFGSKEEKANESAALAKNVDASVIASAGTQAVSAKTPAKTEGDPSDAAVDVEDPLRDRPLGDVKDVLDVSSGAAGETKEPGTELDGVKAALVQHPDASKLAQPFVVRDERESGEPKETAGAGKAQVTSSKKETKDKGSATASEIEVKIAGVTVDIAGMQVATVTPPSGVPAVMAKPNAMGELSESGVGSVARITSRTGVGGVPAVANGPGGKDHARAGKVVAKDAGVVNGKGGEVTGLTPKTGSDAAETRVVATTAKDHSEMKSQGVDGVTVAPVMHGVTSMPGHIAGDNVAAKSHANTAGSIVSAVRDGSVAGDRAPVADGPRTLAATPTTLEVGIANGTHGWLKIRAEMTGGTVNASLSAATSAGQEMLHRELPSLTAYLQEERVGVSAIALHTTTTDTGSREFNGGMDGSTARGQAQQNDSQRGDGRQDVAVGSGRTDEAASYEGLGGIDVGGWLAPAIYTGGGTGGGGWLSVRA
jgi:hypothetical protein